MPKPPSASAMIFLPSMNMHFLPCPPSASLACEEGMLGSGGGCFMSPAVVRGGSCRSWRWDGGLGVLYVEVDIGCEDAQVDRLVWGVAKQDCALLRGRSLDSRKPPFFDPTTQRHDRSLNLRHGIFWVDHVSLEADGATCSGFQQSPLFFGPVAQNPRNSNTGISR